jgi:anti-sigma regulatory factor (Ser/Thr protein kinase)
MSNAQPAKVHNISLRIQSDAADVPAARHAVESFYESHGFDKQACQDVGLCVNEAVANIIRHAYKDQPSRPIQIDAALSQDSELTIRIRDWGSGVNPAELPPKPASIDPLTPGGLGMICLRQMMDEVVFTPQPDGMLLEMRRKKRSPEPHKQQASAR